MTDSAAANLISSVNLTPEGPVVWSEDVPYSGPGIYVIEAPSQHAAAPIDRNLVARWIERVATIRVDRSEPTASALVERLASYWIPDEKIVYIGLASKSVANRIRQFYRTPLGDPRPHAGGHWLKTLQDLNTFQITWAVSKDPAADEDSLLTAFASLHGGAPILPFANRQTAGGQRKPHGITGATLSEPVQKSDLPTLLPTEPPTGRSDNGSDIDAINAALQRIACAELGGEIRAVDAARELNRLGLLKDRADRPGLPLRHLMRTGQIAHAYQANNRWWFVRCVQRGNSTLTTLPCRG